MQYRFIVALLVLVPPLSSAWADDLERLPRPDHDSYAATLELVQDVFQDGYAKTAPDEQAEFAKILFVEAQKSDDDRDAQFVMLREAAHVAADAGDVHTSLRAIDTLIDKFAVKGPVEKADVLQTLILSAQTPTAKQRALELSLAAVTELIYADEFERAEQLRARVDQTALRARARELSVKARAAKKQIADAQAAYEAVEPFVKQLADDADDEQANYQVGRYVSFLKGDWEAGLPLLAKGFSKTLRELAEASLADPGDADEQHELAERWWAIADKVEGQENDNVRVYAASWYRKALPGLSVLNKKRAENRIEEAEAIETARIGKRTINLVSLIDLDQDARPKDKWALVDGVLTCTEGNFVPKVVIPYEPPEEYDIRVTFVQPKLRNPVCIVLPNKHGDSFSWEVGGDRGHMAFSIDPAGGGANPTESNVRGIVQPGRVHTTIVQVRRGGVKAFLDGRPVAGYATDFSDMKANSWRQIDEKQHIAIGCDDPAAFPLVELIEVTGRGKRTRVD